MVWVIETWGKAVDTEIEALPADIRARLRRFREGIEAYGPAALPSKHSKYVGNNLWELRLIGRDGIARIVYVTASAQRVILLRAFVKKTQKTPQREIELALQRLRTIQI
jgi:phage-related protein